MTFQKKKKKKKSIIIFPFIFFHFTQTKTKLLGLGLSKSISGLRSPIKGGTLIVSQLHKQAVAITSDRAPTARVRAKVILIAVVVVVGSGMRK